MRDLTLICTQSWVSDGFIVDRQSDGQAQWYEGEEITAMMPLKGTELYRLHNARARKAPLLFLTITQEIGILREVGFW